MVIFAAIACISRRGPSNFTSASMQKLTEINRDKIRWAWTYNGGAAVDRTRSIVLTNFVQNPLVGNVLVMVDDDIEFSPDQALRLVQQCEKTQSIVGGCYVTRGQPTFIPVRWNRTVLKNLPNTWIEFKPDAELLEVDAVGGGFMAIHRTVATDLLSQTHIRHRFHHNNADPQSSFYDFFRPGWAKYGGTLQYNSEDWHFCWRAQRIGKKIWLDPGIKLIHWGMEPHLLEDIDGFESGIPNICLETTMPGGIEP